VAGGERTVFRGGLRYAAPLSRRLAFKVSAQYLRGRDWQYNDPVEQSKRLIAIAEGADPDTLLIGWRDSTVERVSGEARVDWRPAASTSLVTTVGVNDALRNVDLTPLGAVQVENWRYVYAQTRLNAGRLFAQAFFNASHAGDTYLLRTGAGIIDRSQMVVAQVQHGTFVGERVNLTYGIDAQRTIPRTEGTITGRNEDNDEADELGGYLHGEIDLSATLRLVAAGRLDYHSALPDLVVSPRAALVYQPTSHQTIRLTYDRAFSTPTTNNLFTDIVGDLLPTPVPTPVRLVGVPSTGFSFRRDCQGGLCMRSAYTPADVGDEETWLPIDATVLWPVIVDTLAGRGLDITGIPQPSAAEVATVLGRLNPATESFDPVTEVTDIPALRPTITNTIELGVRTQVDDWLTVGLDVYRGWKNDFVGAERVETPNAFYDRASLEAYLANYLPADQASDIADIMATAPVGTVTPEEARDPYDVLITYRNFGDLDYWGADFEVGAALGRYFTVHGTYSWTSKNLFDVTSAVGEPDTIPLNAPKDRGSLTVRYGDDGLGVYAEIRGRAVAGFPVESGVYAGRVDSYGVLDASVGYRLRRWRGLVLTLSATNLTDNRHQEFLGAPYIGRLVLLRARAEF
jgi:iron complex outermembrane receptor protein